MRTPIQWYGGKANMVAKLLPLIPDHKYYVEPFGGGASLLLAKTPAQVETYNDLDSAVVDFFKVLRDPEQFQRFRFLVELTPYSREVFNTYRDEWHHIDDDPVFRAYEWFILAKMSFSGQVGGAWAEAITMVRRGLSGRVSAYLSTIERLPEIHARMMMVQIENQDFRSLIPRFDNPDTFFYMDPPYVPETRRTKTAYEQEMTLNDHKDLVDMLVDIKGKVLLSGYQNELYAEMLEGNGWKRKDFQTACYVAGKTRPSGLIGEEGILLENQARVESVWYNYDLPTR